VQHEKRSARKIGNRIRLIDRRLTKSFPNDPKNNVRVNGAPYTCVRFLLNKYAQPKSNETTSTAWFAETYYIIIVLSRFYTRVVRVIFERKFDQTKGNFEYLGCALFTSRISIFIYVHSPRFLIHLHVFYDSESHKTSTL